jgi:nitrile hydratase beta subunit
MNGVHDLGGMDGFGKVQPGPEDEPLFHEPWEGRVLAMSRALGRAGAYNIDVGRHGIERLPPDIYLAATYYQRWFLRDEKLCLERGLVTAEELAAGHANSPGKPLGGKILTPDDFEAAMFRPSFGRTPAAPARFQVGDRVRAKNMHPKSHTRLPRYVRGHVGVIDRIQGFYVYPDASVAEGKENPQWLYTVVFNGRELWGDDSDPTLEVSTEAFEPYLEAV